MYEIFLIGFCFITLLVQSFDIALNIKKQGWKNYFFSEENKYKKRYEFLIIFISASIIVSKLNI